MATTIVLRKDPVAETRDALASRVMEQAAGAFNLFAIHIGDQLGFYKSLAGHGPQTAGELAMRTGAHARYTREWLEQQTVAGMLAVENPIGPAATRRFYLPAGHEEVLAEADNLSYLAPLAQLVAGTVRPLDAVIRAYQDGGGVPYEAYGSDLRDGQARMNRVAFLQQLGTEWVPAMTDVDRKLKAQPGARVADLGCGVGWSSIGIALAYPHVVVDGYDSDVASIEQARMNAQEGGVADRVKFHIRDAGDPELSGQYDFVMALECVHDMAHPVAALETMRRLAKEGGAVLVVDERVSESFTGKAEGVEPLMYGFSVLHCLPVGMSDQPSAGTGTVMRPGTLRNYAAKAGYKSVEIVNIEHPMFRFYRLHC